MMLFLNLHSSTIRIKLYIKLKVNFWKFEIFFNLWYLPSIYFTFFHFYTYYFTQNLLSLAFYMYNIIFFNFFNFCAFWPKNWPSANLAGPKCCNFTRFSLSFPLKECSKWRFAPGNSAFRKFHRNLNLPRNSMPQSSDSNNSDVIFFHFLCPHNQAFWRPNPSKKFLPNFKLIYPFYNKFVKFIIIIIC